MSKYVNCKQVGVWVVAWRLSAAVPHGCRGEPALGPSWSQPPPNLFNSPALPRPPPPRPPQPPPRQPLQTRLFATRTRPIFYRAFYFRRNDLALPLLFAPISSTGIQRPAVDSNHNPHIALLILRFPHARPLHTPSARGISPRPSTLLFASPMRALAR